MSVKIEGFFEEEEGSHFYLLLCFGEDKLWRWQTPHLYASAFLYAFSQLLINMLLIEVLFVWGETGFCTTQHVSCNQQY